ncbi:MAG: LysM domain-containing protein [Planctomycetota bacterium]|nr:LysM domain-containing protein [Planctomycetota bacterium]
MKRNETVLVYAVTGLLLGILLVAVVFGRQPVVPADPGGEKSAQTPGVILDLMGAEEDAAPGEGSTEAGGPGETATADGGELPGAGEAISDQESVGATEGGAAEPVALSQPVVVPDPAVVLEKRLEESFGTSRRDGEYRVVKGWQNATLAKVVERWTGGQEALEEARILNESLAEQIDKGDEILVKWVDAQDLLAAKQVRDAERDKIDWAKGELYVLKKGDSLWKVASRRVANNMIPAWLERFKGLNPRIKDLGALVEGQKVRLPR